MVKRKIANEFRAVAPRVIQKVNRETLRVESMVTTYLGQSLFYDMVELAYHMCISSDLVSQFGLRAVKRFLRSEA